MKQLYYTSCETGKSVNGRPGFQVRAATPSLGPDERKAVTRYAGYQLPAEMLDPETLANMPERLSLVDTPESGRILCHTTYVGKDPTTGREGNFFSHVLLDIPRGVTGGSAVRTWGSDIWVRADGDFSTTLPEIDALLPDGPLNDSGAVRFLADERHRQLFQFVLSAFLTTGECQRIFVAAHGSKVAWVLYCLTRVLPPRMLKDLTFSTFEIDPLNTNARLVGSWWGERTDRDLPAACFNGSSVAYSICSGRHSTLPGVSTYAAFATRELAKGDLSAIDELLDVCDDFDVDNAQALELVHSILHRNSELPDGEFRGVLRTPKLCTLAMRTPGAARRILDWAVQERGEARAALESLAAELQGDRCSPDPLVRDIHQAVPTAVRNGQWERVEAILDIVLPAMAPEELIHAFGEATESISDFRSVPWQVREFAIGRLLRLAETRDASQVRLLLDQWLEIPADQVVRLVESELPAPARVAGLTNHIKRRGTVDTEVVSVLTASQELLSDVIKQLASDSETERLADSLVLSLIGAAPGGHIPARLLSRGISVPVAARCIEVLLREDPSMAVVLARRHGLGLRDSFAGTPCLNRVVEGVLSTATFDVLSHPNVASLLRAVRSEDGLDGKSRQRLRAWLAVEAYFKRPSLDGQAVEMLASSLRGSPGLLRMQVVDRIPTVLAQAITRKAASATLRDELVNALRAFGPFFADGPWELYLALLGQWKAGRALRKHRSLVSAVTAVGLGAAPADLGRPTAAIEDRTRAFLGELLRRGGRNLRRTLDRESRMWPSEAIRRWQRLAAEVGPRSLGGRVTRWLRIAAVAFAATLCAALAWHWSH